MDGSNVMQNAIALPFSFDSAGLVNHTNDEKKIWQDRVVMVLMTKLGERVMRPGFGSDVPSVSFENETDAIPLLRQAIGVAFSRWLETLSLIKIEFSTDPIDYYVVADIFYRYGPTNEIENVKIKTAVLTRAGDTILEAE